MLPSISFPVTNLVVVYFDDNLTLWFSYNTLVAFRVNSEKIVRQNVWGNISGKHLNYIDNHEQDSRVTEEEFIKKWEELTGKLSLPTLI